MIMAMEPFPGKRWKKNDLLNIEIIYSLLWVKVSKNINIFFKSLIFYVLDNLQVKKIKSPWNIIYFV